MAASIILSLVVSLSASVSGPAPGLRFVDGAVVVCSDGDRWSEAPLDGDPVYDCTPVDLPVVVECDDQKLSAFFGTSGASEMIGTCDAHSHTPTPLQASLIAAEPVGKRVCTAERCGFERVPAVPSPPHRGSVDPALLSALTFAVPSTTTRIFSAYLARTDRGSTRELLRPPR